MSILGNQIPSDYRRSVVGEVEVSATGNLVLRVGALNYDGSWSQTEHVVLTPEETAELISRLAAGMCRIMEAARRADALREVTR